MSDNRRMNSIIPIRVRAAWNLLRGRPTCYRMRIERGSVFIEPDDPHTFIVECSVADAEVALSVRRKEFSDLRFGGNE